MSVSILMNSNKDLIITSSSTIHQNDIGGEISFILPINMLEGTLDEDCEVKLKILNVGNQLFEYSLTPDEDVYKEHYLKYPFKINSTFSALAGPLTIILTIKKMNGALIDFEIKTGELIIAIEKTNPAFGIVMDGGAVAASEVSDIVVDGNRLILVDSKGQQVGTGVTTTSDAEDELDGHADGIVDLNAILGGP